LREGGITVATSEQRFSRGEQAHPQSVGAPQQLEIQSIIAGGWHTLRLSGELDLVSTHLLDDAIAHVNAIAIDGITLDLSKVAFIDSTGVRAVLTLRERCRERGAEFQIVPGPPAVQRVFDVTGLRDLLPFQPTA
jgi:anti-sigma B factor antagonist